MRRIRRGTEKKEKLTTVVLRALIISVLRNDFFPSSPPSSIFYYPFLPSFIKTYTICWTTHSLSSKGWQQMCTMILATVPPPSINVKTTIQSGEDKIETKRSYHSIIRFSSWSICYIFFCFTKWSGGWPMLHIFFCRKQASEAVVVISNYMSLDFLRILYLIVKLQYGLSEKSFVFLEGQQLD